MMFVSTMASAQKGTEMNLWPNGPRTSNGDAKDTAKVTVFLPNEKKATGRAVVCCPGGGYSHLAMQHEGFDWAPFFNEQGIALIVLKYRMPHGHYTVPAEDAEEAMRLVRRDAEAWHINPNDVGIMGFSAGGHLASTVATHATSDTMPNFQILFYPVIVAQGDEGAWRDTRHLLLITILPFQLFLGSLAKQVVVRPTMGIARIHRDDRIEQYLEVGFSIANGMGGNG